jgi:hypothetical protein
MLFRESATAGETKSAEAPLKQLTIEELNKLPLDERVKYRSSYTYAYVF